MKHDLRERPHSSAAWRPLIYSMRSIGRGATILACAALCLGPAPARIAVAQTADADQQAAATTALALASAAADRYGVSFGPGQTDARAPRALELLGAHGAGAGWVRLTVPWSWVEPAQNRFDWSTTDPLINKAQTEGFQVLGVLGYAAQWSTTAPASVTDPALREHYPPASYAAWAGYVQTVVGHYKNQIHTWEVWNEPDLQAFWGGTPAQYAALLAVAYTSIKSVDPGAQVVLGGLSLGGSPGDLNANFFDQILSDPVYPAASYFDVANFHQYGRASLAQARRDYVATELAKFGVSSRPIWVTEVGYGSAQQGAQADPAFTGLQGQATWLNNMLPLLLNQLGVAKVFWFTLWDDPSLGPFATDGLLDANANPKLAYSALSAALH